MSRGDSRQCRVLEGAPREQAPRRVVPEPGHVHGDGHRSEPGHVPPSSTGSAEGRLVTTYERSGGVMCVRMIREADPYAIPLTSIGRHHQLPAGYANKSLRTCLEASAGHEVSEGKDERLREQHAPGRRPRADVGATGPSGPVAERPRELAARTRRRPLGRPRLRPGDLSSTGCPAGFRKDQSDRVPLLSAAVSLAAWTVAPMTAVDRFLSVCGALVHRGLWGRVGPSYRRHLGGVWLPAHPAIAGAEDPVSHAFDAMRRRWAA